MGLLSSVGPLLVALLHRVQWPSYLGLPLPFCRAAGWWMALLVPAAAVPASEGGRLLLSCSLWPLHTFEVSSSRLSTGDSSTSTPATSCSEFLTVVNEEFRQLCHLHTVNHWFPLGWLNTHTQPFPPLALALAAGQLWGCSCPQLPLEHWLQRGGSQVPLTSQAGLGPEGCRRLRTTVYLGCHLPQDV